MAEKSKPTEAISSPSPGGTNNQEILNKLDLSPATLQALKILSTIESGNGTETLTSCDKLTASLEQIRAKKNMKLFEKLDKIRQDFSELNNKIAKMEEFMLELKEVTRIDETYKK